MMIGSAMASAVTAVRMRPAVRSAFVAACEAAIAFAASAAPAWLKETISIATESPRVVSMPAAAFTSETRLALSTPETALFTATETV